MSQIKVLPTRMNLLRLERSLKLAESGCDILEKKRDVLMIELRNFTYDAQKAREEVEQTLKEAFKSLEEANLTMGSETVENVVLASIISTDFHLDYKSVMGVVVPVIKLQNKAQTQPDYGFAETTASLDKAFKKFQEALNPICRLAELEGSIFQIANDIQKTQKRVNAIKHVHIPTYKKTVNSIKAILEEKEREEFVRMKMVKKMFFKRRTQQ